MNFALSSGSRVDHASKAAAAASTASFTSFDLDAEILTCHYIRKQINMGRIHIWVEFCDISDPKKNPKI